MVLLTSHNVRFPSNTDQASLQNQQGVQLHSNNTGGISFFVLNEMIYNHQHQVLIGLAKCVSTAAPAFLSGHTRTDYNSYCYRTDHDLDGKSRTTRFISFILEYP